MESAQPRIVTLTGAGRQDLSKVTSIREYTLFRGMRWRKDSRGHYWLVSCALCSRLSFRRLAAMASGPNLVPAEGRPFPITPFCAAAFCYSSYRLPSRQVREWHTGKS